jgi:hypothetical protein
MILHIIDPFSLFLKNRHKNSPLLHLVIYIPIFRVMIMFTSCFIMGKAHGGGVLSFQKEGT